LFTPESLTAEANRLRKGADPLHAPSFLDVEVAASAWKKIRRGVMTRAEADFILNELPLLSLTRHPTGPLVGPAFDRTRPVTGRVRTYTQVTVSGAGRI
jgi:predicted nucleic acid-binding protein